ncbi:aminotransferase class I/II-fold pyridoxal phosphate-dependent enzyme [Bradyrhizobium sp. Tv2a-2]|uniref:aminotransferase class I/II-fold pyridoxal phosphate-dependent enzyme n=1 Tax=Bradyrhizobium sp. Tv2a-2 TaxID=113395 RepID=UPI00041A2F40|nr:aminotransferase class I/II-fold pyridoxal phosphate-dependent enzyme [Bradyrhizobium sp. Tv2a-2]
MPVPDNVVGRAEIGHRAIIHEADTGGDIGANAISWGELNAIEGIACRRPEGAFYIYADCADMIGRRTRDGLTIDSDSTFCRYLLKRHDVAAVPGGCFGLAPFFHLSYAASEQDLSEAIKRIANACKELT